MSTLRLCHYRADCSPELRAARVHFHMHCGPGLTAELIILVSASGVVRIGVSYNYEPESEQ